MAYEPSVGQLRLARICAHFSAIGGGTANRPLPLASAAAVAIVYFLAAKLGEALAFPSAPVSALWAPNAILFAVLLLTPVERWWLYLLAVLPLHLVAQLPAFPIEQVAIQYVLNCVESMLGAVALLWLESHPRRFAKLSTMTNLIVLGSIAAPFVTSAALAGAFVVLDLTDDFWLTTTARTLTNTFATMTLVPLIVQGADALPRRKLRWPWKRAPEVAILAGCLMVAGTVVFILPDTQHERLPALLYAPMPLLLFATVRFGIAGASASMLFLGALATWGVLHEAGPFIDPHPAQNALSLVLFLCVTGAPLLLLAAVLQERTHATAALRRSETLHRAVLSSLQDQIAVVDNDGMVIEINDSWRRAREHAQFQANAVQPGDNCLKATMAAEGGGDTACTALRDALKRVLCSAASRNELEFSSFHCGQMRWFELSVESLRRRERGAVISLKDVTARVRAELEVEEQKQQLSHLGRVAVLGEFSGAIAHEIRQPLAAMLSNAEAGVLLLEAGKPDLEAIREILDDIVAESIRAAQVMQRLRSMLGNAEPQRQPMEMNELVQECLMLARVDLARRGVTAIVHLDPNLPSILGDRVQIQQVILNLIVNGCQAMAGAAIDVKRLTLTTRWLDHSRQVELVVADNGEGIDSACLERIFQPFVTTKTDGLGLGLSISRSIVCAHSGSLWVENAKIGTGAVFHLTLPIVAP